MASAGPRNRTSTITGYGGSEHELRIPLTVLSQQFPDVPDISWKEVLLAKLEAAHFVSQVLSSSTNSESPRDAFRRLSGFEALITVLQGISQQYGHSDLREEQKELLLGLLQIIFANLTASLHNHWGNQKYFRKRVHGAGWIAIKVPLAALLASDCKSTHIGIDRVIECTFGCLFACALNDEKLVTFLTKLRRQIGVEEETGRDPTDAMVPPKSQELTKIVKEPKNIDAPSLAAKVRELLHEDIGRYAFLHHAEIIPIILELSTTLQVKGCYGEELKTSFFLAIPMIVGCIADLSTHSLVAMHNVGTLNVLLPMLINPSLSAACITELYGLASCLLKLGVTNLSDGHFLYRNAVTSPLIAELLRTALRETCSPSFIHFDLSLHGYASIELPDIGRFFPPVSPAAGYTFSVWLYVLAFDPDAHTTIFGAFDASQTCFVLVYLEKDTRNLILQTSVSSSRPSVRFKAVLFQEKRWYHVCLVHRRPKATVSSRASLFVDGEFVEQVKSHYPLDPPILKANGSRSSSMLSDGSRNPVQAFLGTPQDLASGLGRNLVSSQWRLASAHLIEEAISDDLIAVYFQLGPRYIGNYQDCLGSFQTYRASAALNIRNESLHPGKEEKSDIVSAIRQKASGLLSEQKIILNISPALVLDDDDRNNIDESQLVRHLSKSAVKTLHRVTAGRNAVVINGAIPSINKALQHKCGFAVLTGDLAVAVPQSLDDAVWRIGGCTAVVLALVDAARSYTAILRALEILFDSIKQSWRNSEAMERENGFGVLANLLASKLNSAQIAARDEDALSDVVSRQEQHEEFALAVLTLVLQFVGYDVEHPENSVINNPLAYRILLVDLDIWRALVSPVQKLYYDQFVVFGNQSKWHQFNSKRLLRMRIVKKWLDALKSDAFFPDTLDYFIGAFKSILNVNMSTEALRSLALYITFATQKSKNKSLQALRPARNMLPRKDGFDGPHRRQTLPSPSPSSATILAGSKPELTHLQIALKVLEMYSDLLCLRTDTANIKKFARTVTNKWLLHLLADDEPIVVVLAAKILARLLVLNGSGYVKKFVEKTGGITIMQYRLRCWWAIPTIWPICFAVMFGRDVATINFDRSFDLFGLLETFTEDGSVTIVYPEILPVLMSMLQNGMKSIAMKQDHPDSPSTKKSECKGAESSMEQQRQQHEHQRSMSLIVELASSDTNKSRSLEIEDSAGIIHTITRFLADIFVRAMSFRDFVSNSNYVQELLFVLFPIIVSSDVVDPKTELESRASALTFNGHDVMIRPLSPMKNVSVIRSAANGLTPTSQRPVRAQPPRRMSSYILVNSDKSHQRQSQAQFQRVLTPDKNAEVILNASNSTVEELLEIVVTAFSDQLFFRKDFAGLGLFMKVPPGFQEHQAYFESFILRNALSHFGNTIQLDQKLLWEPRVLTNLARLAVHLGEAIYEGWFVQGAEATIDFLGSILEYVQRPEIFQLKSTRLCSSNVSAMRRVLMRVVLLRLSELDESSPTLDSVRFLDKLTYWQTVIVVKDEAQDDLFNLLCYLLYNRLISAKVGVRASAVSLWRILLVHKPRETSHILGQTVALKNENLLIGFKRLLELNNESFLNWIDEHRESLDQCFYGNMEKLWEEYVIEENHRTEETAKVRISRRREKLKLWSSEIKSRDEIIRRHEISTGHWRSNIYASEYLKYQRTLQDHQDNVLFNVATWTKMNKDLRRPCGLLEDSSASKWQLDQTEGRNRMRLRIVPDKDGQLHDYQPKRKKSLGPSKQRLSLDTGVRSVYRGSPASAVPSKSAAARSNDLSTFDVVMDRIIFDDNKDQDDDFELIDNPQEEFEDGEDKNRKVMRSLQRGDQVEHVYNVSRVIGLEACEGLLILGKDSLYLLDNLLQRADGEIVNAWQAPQEQRDPYLQMISGNDAMERGNKSLGTDKETRNWRWDDVLSISKRRFLFRDVALEVFFLDGRSYLLTTIMPTLRDELYHKLLSKATSMATSAIEEHSWRIESLRNPDDTSQTLGSRFTNVFGQQISNPATKKWLRGEISNFNYLMLVNTIAGRTFNDLTQYPVFPWVLADYTSQELNLNDPRSFRDLTKPMGCQTPERQAAFRDRYQSFNEMGDGNSPAFHYGTHYSSAMIVTSYLIRLPPFVQSYLLLQGGNFDHADRLFYSIEKAWASASRDNMTDVRELVPEFYYLPDFLQNINEYDFGLRQGNTGAIDDVALPPWAKGDPKIFISKHREALESEYVSKHLHQWIDLIFGYKQRGEPAVEATNVFHHLSYHGAKDLDTIHDPVERLATIGIIHNFGQTPHQVFYRAHLSKEVSKGKPARLDFTAESLTRLPFPILNTENRISLLQYSCKHKLVQSSGAFRIDIAPSFDKYMEWGYVDGSIRFYSTESKALIGLFEHVHSGQISYAAFADSKTLITAGSDCTISVWTVLSTTKSVDIQPQACLFGHQAPITTLAVSRSFSALLSASNDGQIILWDLNRQLFVRTVAFDKPIECSKINNVSGVIVLCWQTNVSLYTLNGELLLEQSVCRGEDDCVMSCAFYEGSGDEYLQRELLFTGHKRGVVNIWCNRIRDGKFVLEHVKRMNHLDPAGYNVSAAMTCILPMEQVVYTGDEDGYVYEWDCIQRGDGR